LILIFQDSVRSYGVTRLSSKLLMSDGRPLVCRSVFFQRRKRADLWSGRGKERKGKERKGNERKEKEKKRKEKEKKKGKETISKEREGKGREGKGREGKGRERKGREGKEREGKEYSRLLQVMSNIPYLFENVERIASADFTPTDTDVLQAKLRTTGIKEIHLEIEKLNFLIVDVGGQVYPPLPIPPWNSSLLLSSPSRVFLPPLSSSSPLLSSPLPPLNSSLLPFSLPRLCSSPLPPLPLPSSERRTKEVVEPLRGDVGHPLLDCPGRVRHDIGGGQQNKSVGIFRRII
jgi:hypothetical protein